jgi:hypothetical protein
MKYFITLILITLFIQPALSQMSVSLFHVLVDESKSEYGPQKEARDQQILNVGYEEANKAQSKTLKERYNELQDRFSKLNIAIDALNLGVSATPLVQAIIDNQSKIVEICKDYPFLIPLALKTEEIFVETSTKLIKYMVGLSLTIGDLNQMKQTERKILFDHALDQLRDINGMSYAAAEAMRRYVQLQYGNQPFDFIDDGTIIDGIMADRKALD